MSIQNKVRDLFTTLSNVDVLASLYAQGTLEVNDEIRLYGKVQCTGDLSEVDCKNCLDIAISELLDQSYRMSGGRSIYGSCYARFEFYAF